jgi:hypothetical protein
MRACRRNTLGMLNRARRHAMHTLLALSTGSRAKLGLAFTSYYPQRKLRYVTCNKGDKIECHAKETDNLPINTKIQPAEADWILSSELLMKC